MTASAAGVWLTADRSKRRPASLFLPDVSEVAQSKQGKNGQRKPIAEASSQPGACFVHTGEVGRVVGDSPNQNGDGHSNQGIPGHHPGAEKNPFLRPGRSGFGGGKSAYPPENQTAGDDGRGKLGGPVQPAGHR